MSAYINGIGMISPQSAYGNEDGSWKEYTTNRLMCIEPDYTTLIDPKASRRMSRILKMGLATAVIALKEAGIEKPEAIITGTAYGCLEDTGVFLKKLIDLNETALNPTPFIQSTHNTIGSQIALVTQCLGYNQTYSQRAFSFEHALLDALMMLDEKDHVLVGGVDEITDESSDILARFGIFKKELVNNLELLTSKTTGAIQGEGAGYFLLSNQKTSNSYAVIRNTETFYKPSHQLLTDKINEFFSRQSLKPADVDLLLLGSNGDIQRDMQYKVIAQEMFPQVSLGAYKHLCGEYPTANAFALWIAAKILKEKITPDEIIQKEGHQKEIKTILIYNQYLGDHHSLILLESC